ncbi:hypothetical protein [Nocardia asteroides]|uniref:hypothetical protein n=1 Tax=Nocardia asteroides TaxID=1824 RepID=UPI0033E52ACE
MTTALPTHTVSTTFRAGGGTRGGGFLRGDSAPIRTLRVIGATQAAVGVALAVSAVAGASVGSAAAAMAVLGLAFLLLGAATAVRPRAIMDRVSLGTSAVLADAVLTVAALGLMMVGWADLSTGGAVTILAAIIAAVVTAIATAFAGVRD